MHACDITCMHGHGHDMYVTLHTTWHYIQECNITYMHVTLHACRHYIHAYTLHRCIVTLHACMWHYMHVCAYSCIPVTLHAYMWHYMHACATQMLTNTIVEICSMCLTTVPLHAWLYITYMHVTLHACWHYMRHACDITCMHVTLTMHARDITCMHVDITYMHVTLYTYVWHSMLACDIYMHVT